MSNFCWELENCRTKAIEEDETAKAAQDPELVKVAEALLEKLKELPCGQINITMDTDIKGDRNIVTGQGDVTITE